MAGEEAQEGPRQLGERYWRELHELVASGEISKAFARRLIDDLTRIDLGRDKRVVVYALGAAMAELLEWEGQEWRRDYFEKMFDLNGR